MMLKKIGKMTQELSEMPIIEDDYRQKKYLSESNWKCSIFNAEK